MAHIRSLVRTGLWVLCGGGVTLAWAGCNEAPDGQGAPDLAALTVTPDSDSVLVGVTASLHAVLTDSAGDTIKDPVVTWTSNDTTVARVDGEGVVTGVAVGRTLVIALSQGLGDTALVVVWDSGPPPPASGFGHVFLVTEENTDYASVVGSGSMPYLNGLISQYGLATQYYANTHPSIGNYFMLATGQVITNNDSYSTVVTADNVVRRLLAAGRTWKSYAEDLPSVGYTGGDTGAYARKHNVFALLSDVVNDTAQRKNLVPFARLPQDLANGTLPDFSNIVPNLCHDAHDCPLDTADAWLRNNIGPLIGSSTFQKDGLLIITFDEAGRDTTYGGGRVVWVAVSPLARRAYQSNTLYQHPSTLRLILRSLGVTTFPGAAASALDMSEFFSR